MTLFAVLCEPNIVVLLDENLKIVWRWEWKNGRLIGIEKEGRGDTLTVMEQGGRHWVRLHVETGQVKCYTAADEFYPFDSFIAFPERHEGGRFAGIVAASQQLRLIALREGKVHVGGPYGIGFIPHHMHSLHDDRRILFTSNTSSTIKILDVTTGEITHSIPAGALVADAGISVDNRMLYACSAIENSLRIWDVASLHLPSRLIHTGEGPDHIVTSRTHPGQLLVYCADDCMIEEWGMTDGQIRKRITLKGAIRHSSVRIHRWINNCILLSGVSKGPYITWWNLDSEIPLLHTPLPGKPLRVIPLHET